MGEVSHRSAARAQLLLRFLDARNHATAMRDDDLAMRGRLHAGPSPLEQRVPQGLLGLRDGARKAALAGVEPFASPRQAGVRRHAIDNPRVPDGERRSFLHPAPSPKRAARIQACSTMQVSQRALQNLHKPDLARLASVIGNMREARAAAWKGAMAQTCPTADRGPLTCIWMSRPDRRHAGIRAFQADREDR